MELSTPKTGLELRVQKGTAIIALLFLEFEGHRSNFVSVKRAPRQFCGIKGAPWQKLNLTRQGPNVCYFIYFTHRFTLPDLLTPNPQCRPTS